MAKVQTPCLSEVSRLCENVGTISSAIRQIDRAWSAEAGGCSHEIVLLAAAYMSYAIMLNVMLACAVAKATRRLNYHVQVGMLCISLRSGNTTASLRPMALLEGYVRQLEASHLGSEAHANPGRRDTSTDRNSLESTASSLHGSEIEYRWSAGMSQHELYALV
jgi:hypothetical protein